MKLSALHIVLNITSLDLLNSPDKESLLLSHFTDEDTGVAVFPLHLVSVLLSQTDQPQWWLTWHLQRCPPATCAALTPLVSFGTV